MAVLVGWQLIIRAVYAASLPADLSENESEHWVVLPNLIAAPAPANENPDGHD